MDLIIYISPMSLVSYSAIVYKLNIREYIYIYICLYNYIRQQCICISLQYKTYSGHRCRVSCGILIFIIIESVHGSNTND